MLFHYLECGLYFIPGYLAQSYIWTSTSSHENYVLGLLPIVDAVLASLIPISDLFIFIMFMLMYTIFRRERKIRNKCFKLHFCIFLLGLVIGTYLSSCLLLVEHVGLRHFGLFAWTATYKSDSTCSVCLDSFCANC